MKYDLPGSVHLSDVLKETKESIEARRHKNTKIVRSKWPVFDRSFGGGLEVETNLIIAARSGQGKSAFASILVSDILEENTNPNLVVLNFNWEMSNQQQGMRYFSNKIGKSVSELKSSKYRWDDPSTFKYKLDEKYLKDIDNVIEGTVEVPMYFFDVSKRVREIHTIIEKIKFINPEAYIINVFDHTRLVTKTNEKSEEEKITNLFAMGNEIKKIGCLNIFISQLNRKLEEEIQQKGYRAPTRFDIFGADSPMQFADNMILLHRPETYKVDSWEFGDDEIKTERKMWGEVVKARDASEGVMVFDVDLANNRITQKDE